MGFNAIIGLLNICDSNDWIARFNRMEGNCNFIKFYIALMLILNMAMNIHLTVRYPTVKKGGTKFSKEKLFFYQVKKMILPILYTVLTTMCAFLSLVFSGIKPIIDFGWMMTLD